MPSITETASMLFCSLTEQEYDALFIVLASDATTKQLLEAMGQIRKVREASKTEIQAIQA